jgi:hypothetical protein
VHGFAEPPSKQTTLQSAGKADEALL